MVERKDNVNPVRNDFIFLYFKVCYFNDLLRQMFGPGVDAALKTYREAPNDPDLAGLLGLFGSTERIVPRWKRTGDEIVGLGEDGSEIVRVPLKEPVYILPAYDEKYQVVRTNCP